MFLGGDRRPPSDLFSLMYTYQGFEDNIISNSTSKTLSILGFNFKASLSKISQYIMSKGYTAEDLGIKGFQIPKASPTSFNQLLNIYTKNKDIHDHIVKEMINADNKDKMKQTKEVINNLYNMTEEMMSM